MAETYNITPERILEVLSIITTENDTGLIPFPFTKESFPEIKKKIDELEIISAGFTFQNILQKLKEANHLDQGTPQKENK
jgi:hypothetical protein